MEQPHGGHTLIDAGSSKPAKLVSGPGPPQGFSKGGKDLSTKPPALHLSFHLEHSWLIPLAVWMAEGVEGECSLSLNNLLSGWLLLGLECSRGWCKDILEFSFLGWSCSNHQRSAPLLAICPQPLIFRLYFPHFFCSYK